MDKEMVWYWRGEIGASIFGIHERMDNIPSEEYSEEHEAFNIICDMALEYLEMIE